MISFHFNIINKQKKSVVVKTKKFTAHNHVANKFVNKVNKIQCNEKT